MAHYPRKLCVCAQLQPFKAEPRSRSVNFLDYDECLQWKVWVIHFPFAFSFLNIVG